MAWNKVHSGKYLRLSYQVSTWPLAIEVERVAALKAQSAC